MRFCINGRAFFPKLFTSKGIERYMLKNTEYFNHYDFKYNIFYPSKKLDIVSSHLWEQFVLPRYLQKGDFLWSPSSSGPINYPDQIVTVHDLMQLDFPEAFKSAVLGYSKCKYHWYRFVYSRILKNTRMIIAPSMYTKKRIINRFNIPENKIAVIYEAAAEHFQPASRDSILSVMKKYGILSKRYILSLSSKTARNKNLRGLIEAWKKCLVSWKEKTDVCLALAGDVISNRADLEFLGLDKIPEQVIFTGYIEEEDLPALYSGASVFVFPSVYEGFGIPPLEAMACNTPVIVSNVTSLPEVCGSAALYVDPLDSASLAHNIMLLLDNEFLCRNLIDEGRKRVGNFSWAKSAEEHIMLFKRIMYEKRSPKI